jgi:hypothetical protein
MRPIMKKHIMPKPAAPAPRPASPGEALRVEGARLVAHYWRAFAELERLRRKLAALDRVLMADYPLIHTPTGLRIVDWVSPERLSAPEAIRKVDEACAHLGSVEDLMAAWRARVASTDTRPTSP